MDEQVFSLRAEVAALMRDKEDATLGLENLRSSSRAAAAAAGAGGGSSGGADLSGLGGGGGGGDSVAALRYDGRLEAMAEGALRRRERRLLLRGFGGWARWAVGSRESAARGRSQEEILQLSAEVVRADRTTARHSPNSLAAWLPGCLRLRDSTRSGDDCTCLRCAMATLELILYVRLVCTHVMYVQAGAVAA